MCSVYRWFMTKSDDLTRKLKNSIIALSIVLDIPFDEIKKLLDF